MRLSGAISAIVICCILFLVFLARENSLAFQQCVAHQETQPDQANIEKFPGIIINTIGRTLAVRCTGRLINKMNAAITALATLAISAFTIVLVIVTDRQARLTADSVAIAKDALLKTERAFVFIDGFNFEITTRADLRKGGRRVIPTHSKEEPDWYKFYPELVITRFALQPRWKNSGSTPTRNMTIQVDWRGPPGPVPPPEYVYRSPPQPFLVPPGGVETSAVIEVPAAVAIVNWSMSPMGVEPFILIWGRADYEDVFQQKHFVEWCHRLRLSRTGGEKMSAGTFQWGDYNRSDEG